MWASVLTSARCVAAFNQNGLRVQEQEIERPLGAGNKRGKMARIRVRSGSLKRSVAARSSHPCCLSELKRTDANACTRSTKLGITASSAVTSPLSRGLQCAQNAMLARPGAIPSGRGWTFRAEARRFRCLVCTHAGFRPVAAGWDMMRCSLE